MVRVVASMRELDGDEIVGRSTEVDRQLVNPCDGGQHPNLPHRWVHENCILLVVESGDAAWVDGLTTGEQAFGDRSVDGEFVVAAVAATFQEGDIG